MLMEKPHTSDAIGGVVKMLLVPIVLLAVSIGSLQGKPTEQNAELKPATPIETNRNEIKETPRNEFKDTQRNSENNKEIPRNEFKDTQRNENNKEIPRNEIKALPSAIAETNRDKPILRGEIIREINLAMDFLNNQIREYSERTKDNREDFKGIIEARNRLEAAIKPLHGVMELDMAASSLETAMTSSINAAKVAMEDLSVKQVKQLEQIAEEGRSKTVEEQERALREYAENHGEGVKRAVEEVFAAKAKADVALETYLRNQGDNLSPEARKANEQMLFLMKDKKMNTEEKVRKLEEYAHSLPEFVRNELNVRDMRELKQLVQTHNGVTPVLHHGIQGGI